MKVCAEAGCPNLQHENRCPNHSRPPAHRRGYGHAHAKLRAAYQQRMDTGERFTCWRCPNPIDPTSWDLGHDDADRNKYRGPECRPCNRSTQGR